MVSMFIWKMPMRTYLRWTVRCVLNIHWIDSLFHFLYSRFRGWSWIWCSWGWDAPVWTETIFVVQIRLMTTMQTLSYNFLGYKRINIYLLIKFYMDYYEISCYVLFHWPHSVVFYWWKLDLQMACMEPIVASSETVCVHSMMVAKVLVLILYCCHFYNDR